MHTNATMAKMNAHPKGKMSISFCRVYVFGCSSWTGAPGTIPGNPPTNPGRCSSAVGTSFSFVGSKGELPVYQALSPENLPETQTV